MFFLAVASLMLIWGRTVLLGSLQGTGFLLYWAGCFAFAMVSSGIALLDVRATFRNIREERAASFRKVMSGIEHAPETNVVQEPVSVYPRRSRSLEAAR